MVTKNKLDLVGKTAEQAAKELFAFVCEYAKELGQDPSIECNLHDPERSIELGFGPHWQVMWEAGPYEWGVILSNNDAFPIHDQVSYGEDKRDYIPVNHMAGREWFLEPYYSFDVCFVEE